MTTIYVDEDVKAKLDEIKREKGFKNYSFVIRYLLNKETVNGIEKFKNEIKSEIKDYIDEELKNVQSYMQQKINKYIEQKIEEQMEAFRSGFQKLAAEVAQLKSLTKKDFSTAAEYKPESKPAVKKPSERQLNYINDLIERKAKELNIDKSRLEKLAEKLTHDYESASSLITFLKNLRAEHVLRIYETVLKVSEKTGKTLQEIREEIEDELNIPVGYHLTKNDAERIIDYLKRKYLNEIMELMKDIEGL